MSDEVIYTPQRSNTHILVVQKYETDYRESYWLGVETFPDTAEGKDAAIRKADQLASTGARIQVVRKARYVG
jgi:hypothetical protein